MGQAADRKVIESMRPAHSWSWTSESWRSVCPPRSAEMKSVVGMFIGSAVLMFLVLRRFRSKKSAGAPSAEVGVRIVRGYR